MTTEKQAILDAATARPWKFNGYQNLVDKTNTLIQVCGFSAPCGYVSEDHVGYANAKLIAEAVNSYEADQRLIAELVAALDEIDNLLLAVYSRLALRPFR